MFNCLKKVSCKNDERKKTPSRHGSYLIRSHPLTVEWALYIKITFYFQFIVYVFLYRRKKHLFYIANTKKLNNENNYLVIQPALKVRNSNFLSIL